MRYKPLFVSEIVNACAILHNICIQNNIPFEGELQNENEADDVHHDNHNDGDGGNLVRQNVVNLYFR